jgi:hypothetical protein
MSRVESALPTVLAIGLKPILKPGEELKEVAEHLSVEEFLSPPWVLPDGHFTEIYAAYSINRAIDPRPIMAELYRVADNKCLLELTVPHGGADSAWEDPRFVRPWYPNSFIQFARPVCQDKNDYDWQAKVVYVRVPDGLLAQMPQEGHFLNTMVRRNVANELCGVLEAVKPARKHDDPMKIKLPKILVQPFSQRMEK